MMDQLGIKRLRPGPSGNEKAPDHANYDEALANPYPHLPDALRLNNGQPVTTAKEWWDVRRPQIVHAFEENVYGKVPTDVPAVHWSVAAIDHEMIGGHPVIAKALVGNVDNSAYPLISVTIHMTLVLPANATGPVPVLMMFGRAGFPAPNQPSTDDLAKINAAEKALLVQQDPSLKQVFADHPAWEPNLPAPFEFPQFNADGDPPNTWELIAAGWGFVTIDPQSIQADNGAGLTRGIIGLVNKGQPRTPDQWGSLRAWAWGAGTWSRLPRDRSRRRCKTHRHRRRLPLRKGCPRDHGLRSTLRHGPRWILRQRWRNATAPQLWRSRREPHIATGNTTGWQATS